MTKEQQNVLLTKKKILLWLNKSEGHFQQKVHMSDKSPYRVVLFWEQWLSSYQYEIKTPCNILQSVFSCQKQLWCVISDHHSMSRLCAWKVKTMCIPLRCCNITCQMMQTCCSSVISDMGQRHRETSTVILCIVRHHNSCRFSNGFISPMDDAHNTQNKGDLWEQLQENVFTILSSYSFVVLDKNKAQTALSVGPGRERHMNIK